MNNNQIVERNEVKEVSENFKKDIVSKILKRLLDVEEYKNILSEDIQRIEPHYQYAWDKLENKDLMIEIVESSFDNKYFEKDRTAWDSMQEAIDSIIGDKLGYRYEGDGLWAKKVNNVNDYYLEIFKSALDGKTSYTISESEDGLNDVLYVEFDYPSKFDNKFEPSLICFHEWKDNMSNRESLLITDIQSFHEEGYSKGLHFCSGKKYFEPNGKEVCDMIIELINREGFKYSLSVQKDSFKIETTSVSEYYLKLVEGALSGELSYSVRETTDRGINDMLDIDIDYGSYNGIYMPSFACFHELVEHSRERESEIGGKIITDIYTFTTVGYEEGMHFSNGTDFFEEHGEEICKILIQLIKNKGFDYTLKKDMISSKNSKSLSNNELTVSLDYTSKIELTSVQEGVYKLTCNLLAKYPNNDLIHVKELFFVHNKNQDKFCLHNMHSIELEQFVGINVDDLYSIVDSICREYMKSHTHHLTLPNGEVHGFKNIEDVFYIKDSLDFAISENILNLGDICINEESAWVMVLKNIVNGNIGKNLKNLLDSLEKEYSMREGVTAHVFNYVYADSDFKEVGSILDNYYIVKCTSEEEAIQEYLLRNTDLTKDLVSLIDIRKAKMRYFDKHYNIDGFQIFKLSKKA